MHSQYQHDNTVKQEMPELMYTKTGYTTVLRVSYKDNLNCRPVKSKFAYHLLEQAYNNANLLKKHVIFLVTLMK